MYVLDYIFNSSLCCVQDTILVIPPYTYCIEEDNEDVPLEDCWYASQQLLFTCYGATCVQRVGDPQRMHPTDAALMTSDTTWSSSAPLRS